MCETSSFCRLLRRLRTIVHSHPRLAALAQTSFARLTYCRISAKHEPAEQAMRILAAGERSEPAEIDRSQLLEPAQQATVCRPTRALNYFPIPIPQARCARQGLIVCCAVRALIRSSSNLESARRPTQNATSSFPSVNCSSVFSFFAFLNVRPPRVRSGYPAVTVPSYFQPWGSGHFSIRCRSLSPVDAGSENIFQSPISRLASLTRGLDSDALCA